MHGAVAQPRAQTLAQLLDRQGIRRALVEQVATGRHERRQFARHQPQRQHRAGQLQLFQPPARQLEQHARFALGRQQADGHFGVTAIAMLQLQA